MNGPQDMGGRHGFGPVKPETGEPVFHADWEKRVLALTLAMGATGTWTLDESRHARESLAPADYLSFSYYQIWFEALISLIAANDLATREEIEAGTMKRQAKPVSRKLAAGKTAAVLASGGPCDRPFDRPPRFAAGSKVRTRLGFKTAHTRLPTYATGRSGTVHAVHGAHVFPDSNAQGGGEDPQWLYSVRFRACDLWGEETTAADVFVDLWEPYLDPA